MLHCERNLCTRCTDSPCQESPSPHATDCPPNARNQWGRFSGQDTGPRSGAKEPHGGKNEALHVHQSIQAPAQEKDTFYEAKERLVVPCSQKPAYLTQEASSRSTLYNKIIFFFFLSTDNTDHKFKAAKKSRETAGCATHGRPTQWALEGGVVLFTGCLSPRVHPQESFSSSLKDSKKALQQDFPVPSWEGSQDVQTPTTTSATSVRPPGRQITRWSTVGTSWCRDPGSQTGHLKHTQKQGSKSTQKPITSH